MAVSGRIEVVNPVPHVDELRLWESLMEMAEIGGLPNGGSCRTALSDEDIQGRNLFVSWCKDADCEVHIDQVGNIYASRPGSDSERLPVATGSHLDTQPHGGKFDGVYGVLAGLEVVRTLNDANIQTIAPIDVVVWTNEEGVRFSPPLAGSCAYAGTVAVDTIHEAETIDGTQVKNDLLSSGYMGNLVPGKRRFDCFIEAHIEQGPILEATETKIGVVSSVQGIRWLVVSVTGQDAHAGTTPMDRRRDAVVGAARMITAANALPGLGDSDLRLTVGRVDIEPNSGATIPGRVRFNCDIRHPDEATLEAFIEAIRSMAREIASQSDLEVDFDIPIQIPPTPFAEGIVDLIRQSATELGFSHRDMLSGAGHDAMNVARVAPTGMIFVPCKDGISHNEAESATAPDLAAGAQTLLAALLARAGVVNS
jgi:N-carbamoyl-L-amino-acid hydrolase